LDIYENDYSTLYALSILYMQQQNWVEAEIRARHMQMLNPDSTEIDQLIKSIKLNSGK
jgi:hypothetical protein